MKPGFRAVLGVAACGTMACATGPRDGGVEVPAPPPTSGPSAPSGRAPDGTDAAPGQAAGPATGTGAGPAASSMDSAPAAPPALECQIRAEPRVKAGQPVTVHFRLVQRSAQPVFALGWRTPFEGLRGDDFRVTRDGVEIPYRGPMVKRGNPSARSYVTLPPGTPVEAEVDLALAYDVGKPGKYRVEFRGKIWDLVTQQADVPRPLERHRAAPLQCGAIDVEVF